MKKSIKTLLSIFVIVAVLTSLFTFNVSAASATISGTGEIEVGKTFNVTIRFNADATLYAVEADVSYNSSVLRLNSVSGADFNIGNGSVKIVDDGFSATKPSKSSSYTLSFTAIAAGNSNISVSLLGGGEAESKASASAPVKVITPKPSSNANLSSIKLSNGSLSPAFNQNTTNYSVTVKYGVESITINGTVADGGASYTGGGTFGLEVGDNSRVLTVTAADGTKKSYTVNIKRMTEQETLDAEQAERDANPLLVVIDDKDYTIVNSFEGITIPTGFTQGTITRKEAEVAVLNDAGGKYQLCWLVDANGENGAFYRRDENDNFSKLAYISANGVMYIIEELSDSLLPSGFVQANYEIDGQTVSAIQHDNEAYKDFYIFNCYVSGQTENTFYRYDTVEGTMQRAAEYDAAIAGVQANPNDNQQNGGKASWFYAMSTTGKIVFFIVIVVALILIAATALVIVRIAGFKENKLEDDVYYDAQTNDEFVLSSIGDDAAADSDE